MYGTYPSIVSFPAKSDAALGQGRICKIDANGFLELNGLADKPFCINELPLQPADATVQTHERQYLLNHPGAVGVFINVTGGGEGTPGSPVFTAADGAASVTKGTGAHQIGVLIEATRGVNGVYPVALQPQYAAI